MIRVGTIINSAAIVGGGIIGRMGGRFMKERYQENVQRTCGICVLFIGIAGAMEKMLQISGGDNSFVDGFVTASLTVSIGAMAIVGALEDGIAGDWSILAAKAVLDFIIILVMTCSKGKGCIFSAIPVFVFEGLITVFAVFIRPFMTELALSYISLVGSILIFCVGVNLVWDKNIRVANLLPAILFAAIAAFLPAA